MTWNDTRGTNGGLVVFWSHLICHNPAGRLAPQGCPACPAHLIPVRPGPYLVCAAPSRPSNTPGPSSLSCWFSFHQAHHLIHPAHSEHHKTSSSCHSVNRFVFGFWICLSCLSDVDMLSNGKGTHPMALSLFISWLKLMTASRELLRPSRNKKLVTASRELLRSSRRK